MQSFRVAVVCSVLFLLGTAFPLFAQVDGAFAASEFYVVGIPIERVFAHTKGYIVEYRKTALALRQIYLPMEWFLPSTEKKDPLKGEIILMGTDKRWPHLVVYYKDGAVDHVRLFVRRDERHPSWGFVVSTPEIDGKFGSGEDLKIEYQ